MSYDSERRVRRAQYVIAMWKVELTFSTFTTEAEEGDVEGWNFFPLNVPPMKPEVLVDSSVTRRLRIHDVTLSLTDLEDGEGEKRRVSEVREREWIRKW
eukprot:CAMPEP_0118661188 /NCGR_PEP_ID=MMETSP0785-20121206/16139_1 /TAXON_ID=91992 /ORGANISM="Bolidomonas pacifica, Strain CCMP 1866" /LENGTH=98 /DNA_ID=CAMNT_0006554597 /DNA_START=745 /DNA_END=1038 /DNA_ORIENTATION=-